MRYLIIASTLMVSLFFVTAAFADHADVDDVLDQLFSNGYDNNFSASINGYQAVPALSLPGSRAKLSLKLNNDQSISYTLTYTTVAADLGSITQAHIHFGRRATNGGVIAFLCSNLGNAPSGTPACPTQSGTVTGTLTAASIVGPSAQGIQPGQYNEVIKAIKAEATYGCVHSTVFPGGSIRGAIK